MQNPGRVLPRTRDLRKGIGSSPYDVDANLLDVYMSKLRSATGNRRRQPLFKTVRGSATSCNEIDRRKTCFVYAAPALATLPVCS